MLSGHLSLSFEWGKQAFLRAFLSVPIGDLGLEALAASSPGYAGVIEKPRELTTCHSINPKIPRLYAAFFAPFRVFLCFFICQGILSCKREGLG